MAELVILNSKWFLFICIGVLINEVMCIELNMITEYVIKGEPIKLFCHIPNFTNIASFNMPNGMPFKKVFCNNRDGCSIKTNELFNVNSNSSGLILTLKDLNEKIEGEYACIYKGEVKTYSLNTSTLDILDPYNGCKVTKIDVEYKCQTKCLEIRNIQLIMWKFQSENDETLTWNTSAPYADCLCCKNNKQQLISCKKINGIDGILRCFITMSRNVTLWSRPKRVKSVADGYHQEKTVIIISIISFLVVVVVSVIFILYKRHKKHNTESSVKEKNRFNSSEVERMVKDKKNSGKDESMAMVIV